MSFNKSYFFKHLAQTSPEPLALEIISANGMYLTDIHHKKYIDLIAGIGVSALGHGWPSVVKAIKDQAELYLHTMVYGEFILSPQVNLAKELADVLPNSLNSIYLVNSGAEAIEGAMKLAKRYTGKSKFIAATKSYHGSTQGAMSLVSEDWFAQAFRPLLPNIHFIDFNRCEDIEIIDEQTAAVVLETVKAEEGIVSPIPGYLEAIKKQCEKVGALLILDEIQAGYGRTGTLFAFEKYEVVPDILCLAKGFGGGMPLGAFIADQKIMRCLTQDPILGHITTYGGHPVSAAAALATLKELKKGTLINEIASKSERINAVLHKENLHFRNNGLWYAIEAGNFSNVLKIVKEALDNGILVDWFLFNDHCIRLAPPLIIENKHIDKEVALLAKIIAQNNT
jgi:acetylornithine/succinyldiaminopimelate/putrescine aminotransferase